MVKIEDKDVDEELEKTMIEFENTIILDTMKKKIDFLEAFYMCMCCEFSDAYLNGSEWYIGPKLVDWWDKVEYNCSDYEKKFNKLKYIEECIKAHFDIEDIYF